MGIVAGAKAVGKIALNFADDAWKGGKAVAKGAAQGGDEALKAARTAAKEGAEQAAKQAGRGPDAGRVGPFGHINSAFQGAKGAGKGAADAARALPAEQQRALVAAGGMAATHEITKKTSA